jgi:hypothetical protein
MTLSTFLTFLAFLTRKLRWIRREALGRRLDVEQTRSLLDGLVRAGWLRLVTTKTAAALSIGGVSTRCSFPGHQRQKGQEGQKGVSVMTPSNFPTFLTFLTRKLCFRHSPPAPWQGPEIPSYPGRQRLGPPTVGPTGRPESWSQVATAPAGASRIDAAMPHGS